MAWNACYHRAKLFKSSFHFYSKWACHNFQGAICQNPQKWKQAIPLVLFQKLTKMPLLVSNALFSAMGGHDGLGSEKIAQNFVNIAFGKAKARLRLVFDILRNAGASPHSELINSQDSLALLLHIALAQSADKMSTSDDWCPFQTNVVNKVEQAITALFSLSKHDVIDFPQFSQFSREVSGDIAMMVLGFLLKKLELTEKLQTYVHSFEVSKQYIIKEEKWCEGIAKLQHLKSLPFLSQKSGPLLSKLKENSGALLQNLAKRATRSTTQNLTKPEIQRTPWQSGHVYRFVKRNVIRAFWYELRGSDLYMFRTKTSSSPKMIVPLGPGFSVKDKCDPSLSPKVGAHSDKPLYSFELVFPSGMKKEFLFFDSLEKRAWFASLYSILDDFDLQSEYELLNEVEEIEGEIQFKGFSHESGQPIILSVLQKRPTSYTESELDDYSAQIMTRLEVLRICKHPLIPRLINIHETTDNFYIAQEPTEGGDLASYFQREGITEKVVAHILSQMAEILCFLSKMNIVVGNLKLQSFFLAEAISPSDFTTLPQIRLVDLSEAIILTPHSNPSAMYTLYSAPQVIENDSKHIGVASDAFSLGVILCKIFFSKLPFSNIQDLQTKELVFTSKAKYFGSEVHSIVSGEYEANSQNCLRRILSSEHQYKNSKRM